MWMEKITKSGRQVFVFMPGVPFEMKAMMEDTVLPLLKKACHPESIYHKTILTQGIGESFLSDILQPWEDALPKSISLAYLPQPGIVRLRLTGMGDDENTVRALVESEAAKLAQLIPQYIFGYGDETLELITGRMLRERRATLSTAESCTGGYIAHLLTTIPGSSDYFKGSVVAYDNSIKTRLLDVPEEVLQKHGAVSEAVVRIMAETVRRKFETDYAIAVSGIAGPSGETPGKPVGTTWIAVAGPGGVKAFHYLLGDHRERNIRRAALQTLRLLMLAMENDGNKG
jgi:nicotinamide-nucleotide amidase